MNVRYAESVVSLMHIGRQRAGFPGNLFAPPEELINQALDIGYAGVQALPIRGLTGRENDILLFEDPWNAVPSLWHALRHYPGASGLPSCLNDWVVSPTPLECEQAVAEMAQREITQVVHHFDGNADHLVEVNPGLDMTPGQILEKCEQTGHRLVLDTEHICRGYRNYEIAVKSERKGKPSPLGESHRAAAILSPWVSAIHLKPIGTSIEKFVRLDFGLAQEEKILCDYVLTNSTSATITIVAEYPPTKSMLLSPTKSRDIAARMLEAMHRLVEE